MFKKLLLIITFIGSGNLLPGISPKGTKSQIMFGPNSQLQANASMSGLSNSVLFPANSNFQLNNNNSSASLGGISSTAITFGLDNIIELTGDATIGQSDQTWVFPYNATIDGKGRTLTILAPQGIVVSGSATLTIVNAMIICGARQAIGCNSDSAVIALEESTVILGSEGLFWSQGNLTTGPNVSVQGQDKSFFLTPSQSEFTTQLTTLGFSVTTQHENSALYTMDFSGPSDDRAGITMTAVDKTGAAYYSDDNSVTTRTWHQVTAGANPYVSISTGSDGTIWLADTAGNIYVYRVHKDTTPALVQAQNITANFVSVGNRFNVYALNSTSGNVYKCSDPDRGYSINPLTGAPQTWVQVPNVRATSIAAGYDGSLWYINASGQVILRASNNSETLVHDGAGHTFVKVSAKGSATNNSVALTCLATSRAYISQNNGAFKDIGLANVVEAATDIDGNLMMIFDNSILAEDPTYGAPIYYRHSFAEKPVLAMDKTLNFAASAGANLTITAGGTLALGEGTTLRMSADSGALETSYNARRHLVFTDNSSILLLDRANIEAVSAGLSLTSGAVIINGICGLFSSSWPGCQTEISADVRLKIHSASNLQTYGQVDYCSSRRLYSTPTPTVSPTVVGVTESTYYSALFSRGFASTASEQPIVNSNIETIAVAYNPSADKIKTLGVFTNINGPNDYYFSEISKTSKVPTLTNYQDANVESYISSYNSTAISDIGYFDLGEDDSIILATTNGLYIVWVNGSVVNLRDGTHQVSMTNSSNYGLVDGAAGGTVFWWKPSGNINISGLGQRSMAITIDALWYVNNIGEIWYIPASNTSLRIRYTGSRGLDAANICVRGPLTNYKIMVSDTQSKFYSGDSSRPLEFENIYANPTYPLSAFSITTTGFVAIRNYFGYMKGCAPSFWSAGDTRIYVPSSTTAIGSKPWPSRSSTTLGLGAYATKGVATPSWISTPLSTCPLMKARYIGNQIELTTGDVNQNRTRQTFSKDLTTWNNPTNYSTGFMAGANDGSYLSLTLGTATAAEFDIHYVDSSGNDTVIMSVNNNTTSGAPDPRNVEYYAGLFYGAMYDANSVYIVLGSTGKLQKWAGGTSWTDVYTDYTGLPTTLSPSSDGGFWYTNRHGALNYRAQDGTITPVRGSTGSKWIRVTTAGSSSQYKLLAVRDDGILFSCDQSRGLESEEIYSIDNMTVLIDGFYIAKSCLTDTDYPPTVAGWIKGTAPKWWTKLYPISG